jgi:hypothetical protein
VQKYEHKHFWIYNENEEAIAHTSMVLVYQYDEIDKILHDVICDVAVNDVLEVLVPIADEEEETMVAAVEVGQFANRTCLMQMDSILKTRTTTLYGNTLMKMK